MSMSNLAGIKSQIKALCFFNFFQFMHVRVSIKTLNDYKKTLGLTFTQAALRACKVTHHVQLCNPMDCSPPGSSVHGIHQTRILVWVAISFYRGSFWPRDWAQISYVSCMGRWVLYLAALPQGNWKSFLQSFWRCGPWAPNVSKNL